MPGIERVMLKSLMNCLYVGVGGMIGSLCRYGLTLLFRGESISMPYGTLLSNVAGCLVIGAVMELASAGEILSPAARLFLATGFCGGFTTLSSLVYELMQMLRDGEWIYAGLYFALTIAGAMIAFGLGALAMKAVVRY
jgi:CrcB protein